jgi:hypothetical protein
MLRRHDVTIEKLDAFFTEVATLLIPISSLLTTIAYFIHHHFYLSPPPSPTFPPLRPLSSLQTSVSVVYDACGEVGKMAKEREVWQCIKHRRDVDIGQFTKRFNHYSKVSHNAARLKTILIATQQNRK